MAKKVEKKPVKTNYKKLAKRVAGKISTTFQATESQDIIKQIKNGDTNILKYERVENTIYDPTWIDVIEDSLFDIGQIIQNPKKVTREDTDVVPVEVARKTNAKSVIHLATHSQYVKKYDEDGTIIPNKILNIGSEDYLQTYENRFVATLVRKLVLFVEKRFQFLLDNVNVKKTQVLMMKNKAIIDGKEVEIETKVKIRSDLVLSEEQINKNKAYINRVLELKRYLLFYYNSEFMKALKTERNVRNPILMTNIIRKNPLYHKCYVLYRFIESYDSTGVNFKIKEKYDSFDEAKLNQINDAFLLSYLYATPDETIRDAKRIKERKYRPHFETTSDDEIFIYGPLYNGPIEFVRADKNYLNYIDNNVTKLQPHMTNKERVYYGTEISDKKVTKKDLEEVNLLLKRKSKKYKTADKKFSAIVEKREEQEKALQAKLEKQRENEILKKYDDARKEIKETASQDKKDN